MKLDDPFLGKAQVHAFCVLQVEGTLVELGDGVVSIQQGCLLVHLADDLKGKGRESEREREISQLEDGWMNGRGGWGGKKEAGKNKKKDTRKEESRYLEGSQKGMTERQNTGDEGGRKAETTFVKKTFFGQTRSLYYLMLKE